MIRALVLTFALSLALVSAGHAATVVLTPDRDNTLYQSNSGAVSNDLGTRIFAGRTNQVSDNLRRAVLHFDLSGIPSGSTINSVSLTLSILQTSDIRARNAGLHRLTSSWTQGTATAVGGEGGGATSTPGSATWIHRSYSSSLWTTPGGDFVATASATASVGLSGTVTWSGAGLVADVQSWIDSPSGNHGWLVRNLETVAATSRAFGSVDNPTSSLRPTLTVNYTAGPTPVEATTWGRIKSLLP